MGLFNIAGYMLLGIAFLILAGLAAFFGLSNLAAGNTGFGVFMMIVAFLLVILCFAAMQKSKSRH